jgi:hypothetical protein
VISGISIHPDLALIAHDTFIFDRIFSDQDTTSNLIP